MTAMLKKNDIVLLQGDSITDTARDRESGDCLGRGYALMLGAWCSCNFPEENVKFLNRGLSGNRVIDLLSRIEKDFIEIRPSWISILIGVNDCWRRYDRDDPTSAEVFEERYRNLLTRLKQDTTAKIILCEPFLLPVKPEQEKWREDLDPKISVVKKMAEEFNTLLVPLSSTFLNAAKRKPMEHWSKDGVHPTPAGHMLIAQTWLKTLGICPAG